MATDRPTVTGWAVYVADDNGWLDGCQDFEGVFFGDIPAGGEMVYKSEGSPLFGGHVRFAAEAEAESFLRHLDASGDWNTDGGDGEERRPSYDLAPLHDPAAILAAAVAEYEFSPDAHPGIVADRLDDAGRHADADLIRWEYL